MANQNTDRMNMTDTLHEQGQQASPCVMVIFGASGDLTKRKLIPALCNLAKGRLLSPQFAVIGFSYNSMTTEAFRAQLTKDIKEFAPEPIDSRLWDWFLERTYYVQGDFQDSAAYGKLQAQIAAAEKTHSTRGNRFFYLAVSPKFFAPVVKQLGQAGLTQEEDGKWARVIVEKPFGRDLASAKQLNRDLKQILDEQQIYRIDHYLGKETVQNLMVFRFANAIAEPLFAYRTEPMVSAASNTETYAALRLEIDNWRWAGVPFYLRTGKRLARRTTEIAIQFRRSPFVLFRNTKIADLQTNRLVIHIQPDEGISLRFGAKVPGPVMQLGLVNMEFDYARDFGHSHSTGYERLMYDCMMGDATLFQRADMVEAGWRVIQPVLDAWSAAPAQSFPNYAAGTWGPAEADELLARGGRTWRTIGKEQTPPAPTDLQETLARATAGVK